MILEVLRGGDVVGLDKNYYPLEKQLSQVMSLKYFHKGEIWFMLIRRQGLLLLLKDA